MNLEGELAEEEFECEKNEKLDLSAVYINTKKKKKCNFLFLA